MLTFQVSIVPIIRSLNNLDLIEQTFQCNLLTILTWVPSREEVRNLIGTRNSIVNNNLLQYRFFFVYNYKITTTVLFSKIYANSSIVFFFRLDIL